MNTEPRRTLVVDLDFLTSLRSELSDVAETFPSIGAKYSAHVSLIDKIIAHGTTVDMDPTKVAGFAQALFKVAEIREQQEDDRVYSEAQAAVDAEWTPSGGAA